MSVSFSNLLTPNNLPYNARSVVDNNFVQVIALNANAAATTNTGAIDLQQAVPYSVTEIVTVQVSADNSNWANSNIFATPLISVAASNGSIAATSCNIKLDPGTANSNTSRYIRAQFAGVATGGTYTAGPNGFIQLLF
jgi:hypothetical protein